MERLSGSSAHAPTVAHEGNPRATPALTVSGTLDGTATLIMQFPQIPITTTIPTEASPSYRISTPHSTKYVLSVTDNSGNVPFSYGVDSDDPLVQYSPSSDTDNTSTFIPSRGWVKEYSKSNNVLFSGCIVSPPVLTNLVTIDRDASVLTFIFKNKVNLDTYAAVQTNWADWGKSPLNADITQIQQNAFAKLKEDVTTHPFSGVAVGVKPDSTVTKFTGLVYAYNWYDNQAYLMYYQEQSLENFGNILASADFSGAPKTAAGTTFSLNLTRGTGEGGSSETWSLAAAGMSVTSKPDSWLPYFGPDMRVALVNLPTQSTDNPDDYLTWENITGNTYIS